MYKKFFMGIAAIAALTLVSCSSDDLNSLSDNSSKNEAISFDGYLGRSAVAVNGSRGSVLTKDALQKSTEGFGVFGNYSAAAGQNFGSNLFNNQQVTYSTEPAKWTYTNTKYWPTEGHIDFLAYAPYLAGTTLKDKISCIDFTVENDVAKQKDLLWANAKDQTMQTISGTDNKVKFTFNHALAKIGYSVKLKEAYSGATIKLNKITLAGSADGNTPAFYKKATIDLSKAPSAEGPWSNQSSDKQKFDWVSTPYELTSTEAYTPNKENNYLFVIPQNFSEKIGGAENPDKLYVIVEYTVELPLQTGTTGPMTTSVFRKLEKNFEQGKAYMINLTIGLTPIEFDADVTDWGVDNEINIDSWK